MDSPVITFFNNKGGVGKTSLVYHVAWMLSELGHCVLVCDLDPQANLTTAFIDEDGVEALWGSESDNSSPGGTIFQCVQPLMGVGDLQKAEPQRITSRLQLIPGDLALSTFEDELSAAWPRAMDSSPLRAMRVLTAFSSIVRSAAEAMEASVVLADVGPNLGAINRSVLIGTDYVAVPLAADLFSLQGLRNLGPTLSAWQGGWEKRRQNWSEDIFPIPRGRMTPVGYIVQQIGVRLNRPVKAYDRWVNRMPREYAKNLLGKTKGPYPSTPSEDGHCLATVKHYRSLVPLAQEARKPVFKLTPADGALGGHAAAANDAHADFKLLAEKIATLCGIESPD